MTKENPLDRHIHLHIHEIMPGRWLRPKIGIRAKTLSGLFSIVLLASSPNTQKYAGRFLLIDGKLMLPRTARNCRVSPFFSS